VLKVFVKLLIRTARAAPVALLALAPSALAARSAPPARPPQSQTRAQATSDLRASLLRELQGIRAIDDHAHIVRPVDGDTEYDALPFALLDPPPPGAVAAPWGARNEYPWFLKAWTAIYGWPSYRELSPARLKEAVALKQKAIATHGAGYPAWILDRQGVEIALANRIAMGPELPASRFRWVPYADALLFPLDNSAQKAANRDYAAFYPAEEKLLQRYMADAGVRALPPSLDEYCRTIVTPTLERQKAAGAVAEKLEAAYLRWLDFGPAAQADAARFYAQYAKGGVAPAAEYKILQDYLFAYLAREAGRLGMAIHIHVANGGGANYDQRGGDPLLLSWAFNEPSLRKTTFVVIHGGYPFYDATLGLISKPNVYADFSAISVFDGVDGQAQLLRRWLGSWPEKVLYGSDASPTTDEVSWEETGWVASQTARRALAAALADLVEDGTITRARASAIGRMVLRDNAKKLYGF